MLAYKGVLALKALTPLVIHFIKIINQFSSQEYLLR